jgi:fatty acid desaturase
MSPMKPERDVWRGFVGDVAWPTLLLGSGIVAGELGLWGAALTGHLPLWVGFFVATALGYSAFTVMHEAVHGNIHGDKAAMRPISEALGWLAGITLFAPLPLFRVLHLRHHSFTNHGEKDPDHWVKGGNALSIALRCASIFPHYFFDFFVGASSNSDAARAARITSLIGFFSMVALAVALSVLGFGVEVLTLWVLPALTASALLAFAFDWLPHAPHTERRRYLDTRVMEGSGLALLLFFQNYHLIHHLYPRVPFYRYRALFQKVRPELEREGSRIEQAF